LSRCGKAEEESGYLGAREIMWNAMEEVGLSGAELSSLHD
jgi:hypothetical protein